MNAKFKENEKPLRRKTSRILHVQHARASWNEHSQMRSRKKKLEEVLTRLLIDGVHQLQPFTNILLCPTYFWSDDDIKTFVAPRNDVLRSTREVDGEALHLLIIAFHHPSRVHQALEHLRGRARHFFRNGRGAFPRGYIALEVDVECSFSPHEQLRKRTIP